MSEPTTEPAPATVEDPERDELDISPEVPAEPDTDDDADDEGAGSE